MSHATTFGSLLGAAKSLGVRHATPQADYDRVRMAGTPIRPWMAMRAATGPSRIGGYPCPGDPDLCRPGTSASPANARQEREARFAAMSAKGSNR